MPVNREPQLAPSDIKLLRLFLKVVECGGFSGAQAELNVSASSISTQMATLESRLGVRLCERGRVGFRLTEKGRRVHASALRLEDAIDTFRMEIGEMRGKLVGELQVGIVDSTASNPDCRLHDAIARFSHRDHAVHIALHIAEPASLERRLLDGQLHIGIGAFYHHVPGLIYSHLFHEEQSLYCGAAHPFFHRAPHELTPEEVQAALYVGRGYIARDLPPVASFNVAATAFDMEASLTLIRSGSYIGHLPKHFGQGWEARGELRRILPGRYDFKSEFEDVLRKGVSSLRLIRAFLEDLRSAHGMTTRVA
jgi:LysR family transcriptional regulator, transcriptional activator for bauABCD operon